MKTKPKQECKSNHRRQLGKEKRIIGFLIPLQIHRGWNLSSEYHQNGASEAFDGLPKDHFIGKTGSQGRRKGRCLVCNNFGHYAGCLTRRGTSLDDDNNRLSGKHVPLIMASWSLMPRCWATLWAVAMVAVAVNPSKHLTPSLSLNTFIKITDKMVNNCPRSQLFHKDTCNAIITARYHTFYEIYSSSYRLLRK